MSDDAVDGDTWTAPDGTVWDCIDLGAHVWWARRGPPDHHSDVVIRKPS